MSLGSAARSCRRAWAWWVGRCHRPVDGRPLALVRIALCLVIALDQLRLARLGLVPVLYRAGAAGGLYDRPTAWFVMDDLFGAQGGVVAWALTIVAAALAALGVWTRTALLVCAFAYGQLAHGFWVVDNGGDRIARTVLVMLALGGVHRVWALGGPRSSTVPGWNVDLVRWFLALVYLSAGLSKVFPRPSNWLAPDGQSVTYRILTYPMTSSLDAVRWAEWPRLMEALDVATISVELSAFLVLTRHRRWWALLAAPIHVGIWVGMTIDVFAAVMLALYALLFDAWIVAGLDRVSAAAPWPWRSSGPTRSGSPP